MILMIFGQIAIQQKVQEMIDGNLIFARIAVVRFVCPHLSLYAVREVIVSVDSREFLLVVGFGIVSAV